jgi:hypothetical protein
MKGIIIPPFPQYVFISCCLIKQKALIHGVALSEAWGLYHYRVKLWIREETDFIFVVLLIILTDALRGLLQTLQVNSGTVPKNSPRQLASTHTYYITTLVEIASLNNLRINYIQAPTPFHDVKVKVKLSLCFN